MVYLVWQSSCNDGSYDLYEYEEKLLDIWITKEDAEKSLDAHVKELCEGNDGMEINKMNNGTIIVKDTHAFLLDLRNHEFRIEERELNKYNSV